MHNNPLCRPDAQRSENIVQSKSRIEIVRSRSALISYPLHNAVTRLPRPRLDCVFLNIETEPVLGLPFSTHPAVPDQSHADPSVDMAMLRALICDVNVVTRD